MQTQGAANRTYDFSHSVGGRDMMKPYGIALAGGNVVYVVNRAVSGYAQLRGGADSLPQIKKVDTGDDAAQEELILEFARMGEGSDDVFWPSGISCDSDDNVYIADEWLHRISIFDENGVHLDSWGAAGSEEGKLLRPSGIQFDADDNLYVVDAGNHRVQKFTRDGALLAAWGSKGAAPGQFSSPWGITIDADGFVYVADHRNNRVQKFTPDGDFVLEIGSYGSGVGELDHPTDVAVDPEGDVYICDWANHRVNAYDKDGKFFISFVGDAVDLSKWQQGYVKTNDAERLARRRVPSLEPEWRFGLPTSVEFEPRKGWLIVADTQRGRFQVYAKLKDYAAPQFNL